MNEVMQQVIERMSSLDQYQLHIAHHVVEAEYDLEKLLHLLDNTMKVTSNWRMKIYLLSFTRTNFSGLGRRKYHSLYL